MRSYASLLSTPPRALDPKAQRALEVIGRNTDRALHLLNAVFDHWRLECGALAVEPASVPLRELLVESADRARRSAAGQTIRVDYPQPLGNAWLDEGRLAVALDVFWRFGLGRTPPGGILESGARTEPHHLEVWFTDPGPAPDFEEDLLDPERLVARVQKLDERFELAVAATLLKAQQAEVTIGSTGDSTTLRLRLPRAS